MFRKVPKSGRPIIPHLLIADNSIGPDIQVEGHGKPQKDLKYLEYFV
jgi:hypothetical protein